MENTSCGLQWSPPSLWPPPSRPYTPGRELQWSHTLHVTGYHNEAHTKWNHISHAFSWMKMPYSYLTGICSPKRRQVFMWTNGLVNWRVYIYILPPVSTNYMHMGTPFCTHSVSGISFNLLFEMTLRAHTVLICKCRAGGLKDDDTNDWTDLFLRDIILIMIHVINHNKWKRKASLVSAWGGPNSKL